MDESNLLYSIRGKIRSANSEGKRKLELVLPLKNHSNEEVINLVSKIKDIKKAYIMTRRTFSFPMEHILVIEW